MLIQSPLETATRSASNLDREFSEALQAQNIHFVFKPPSRAIPLQSMHTASPALPSHWQRYETKYLFSIALMGLGVASAAFTNDILSKK